MKITRIFITILFIALFIIPICGQGPKKAEADKVWQMLEKGNTEDAFWYLVDLYRRNGADVEIGGKSGLKLRTQDYKEIINKYSNGTVTISLSRMMTPDESAGYWENWSRTLARGDFDHQRFFKDDRERFLFANFNVLVLAAHEIGHYLDYRYLINDRYFEGGMLSTKTPMNCVENYADKFAVATVNYLSQDSRFAQLRPRYLELIKYFNHVIPAENRYNWESVELIGKGCEAVDLFENGVDEDGITVNENFFRQYTSAYFNRHRLMLENEDSPTLKAVIEQELLEPFFRMFKLSDSKFKVRTLREFSLKNNRDIFYGGDRMREMIEFYRSLNTGEKPRENVPVSLKTDLINDKGELRILEFSWTAKKLVNDDEKVILRENGFSVKISNSEERGSDSVRVSFPRKFFGEFIIAKAILPSDREVLAILVPFDPDPRKRFKHVVVLQLTKEKTRWQPKFVEFTLPNLKNADEIADCWFMTPERKLNVLQRIEQDGRTISLTQYEVDRMSFTPRLKRPAFVARMETGVYSKSRREGRWLSYNWGQTVSGNDSGKLIVEGSEYDVNFISNSGKEGLFEIGEKGKTLLSNFSGIIDGRDPRHIRVSNIGESRFLSEDRVVFIDAFNGKTYLRELVFDQTLVSAQNRSF